MWAFFPMVSLLIRAIVGSAEIDNSLRDIMQPRDGSDIVMTIDNHQTEKNSMDDVSEVWKTKQSFVTEEKRKQTDPSTVVMMTDGLKENENLADTENDETSTAYDRGIDSNIVKLVSKRRETVESWLNSPKKDNKVPLREKRNPWLYWWGDKGVNPYGSSSNNAKPTGVPFDDWGGKRGKEYSRSNAADSQAKRTRITTYDRYDRYDRDASMDEYGVKKVADDIGKVAYRTPFDSWGGKKRAEKSIDRELDREQYLLLTENPNGARVLGVFKDEFSKGRNSFPRKVENTDDEKQEIETKSGTMSTMFGGRSEDNYDDADNEITDVNDWLTLSMPDKRVKQHGQWKKTKFNPWGGKRSLKTYTFRFGNEYFSIPAYSAKGGKVFFPWGG